MRPRPIHASVVLCVLAVAVSGLGTRTVTSQDAAPSTPEPTAWEWLCAKYDKNEDGKIARKEYTRDAAHWARLDGNADGWLTKDEFEGRRPDKGGAKKEGREGEEPAPKEGELAPEFALEVLAVPPKPAPGDGGKGGTGGANGSGAGAGGQGKAGSAAKGGSKPGAAKPAVVKLSDFKHKKPVALVFGSYT
jgi:hypothetical protein